MSEERSKTTECLARRARARPRDEKRRALIHMKALHARARLGRGAAPSASALSVTVVQADSRFCKPEEAGEVLGEGSNRLHYWWESARTNALWAAQHGYRHRLYCVDEVCEHVVAGKLYTAWCKIRALQDALAQTAAATAGGGGGLTLYLDSDAFWPQTEASLEGLVRQYVPASDWEARGADSVSIFFGCNLPWNGEDRGRRPWNASLPNAERRPPNDGVTTTAAFGSYT